VEWVALIIKPALALRLLQILAEVVVVVVPSAVQVAVMVALAL
jgi:hypothetical protein